MYVVHRFTFAEFYQRSIFIAETSSRETQNFETILKVKKKDLALLLVSFSFYDERLLQLFFFCAELFNLLNHPLVNCFYVHHNIQNKVTFYHSIYHVVVYAP